MSYGYTTEYDACRKMEWRYRLRLKKSAVPTMADLVSYWPGILLEPILIVDEKLPNPDGYAAWYKSPKKIFIPHHVTQFNTTTLIHEFAHHVCYHERLPTYIGGVSQCHGRDFLIVNEFLIISHLIKTGAVDERRILRALKIGRLDDFLISHLEGA